MQNKQFWTGNRQRFSSFGVEWGSNSYLLTNPPTNKLTPWSIGLLQNPALCYYVHSSMPLVSVLSQIIPVHTLPSCFFKNCSPFLSYSITDYYTGLCGGQAFVRAVMNLYLQMRGDLLSSQTWTLPMELVNTVFIRLYSECCCT